MALALVCLTPVAACGPALEDIVAGAEPAATPPIHLGAVVYQGYRDGAEEYELRALEATVRSAEDRAVALAEVEIDFQDPSRGDVSVVSDRGELDLVTEDFTLEGNVNGRLDGQRFQTSQLRFDHGRRRLVTDRSVVVERGSLVLRGKGMEYDVATRKLSFVDVETTAAR